MNNYRINKVILIAFSILTLFMAGMVKANEIRYLTVKDDKDWSGVTKGDYYVRFIARYAHIRKKNEEKGFWKSLSNFFSGKDNPQALVIASVGYKSNDNNVEAGSILLSLDPSGKEYDDSYIAYNKPLLPPMRVSNFNQMNVSLLVKESTVKDVAPFARIVESANEIPMINEASLGKISIANDIIKAISNIILNDKGSKLRVSLDIDSRDKLFEIDKIIFFPSSELSDIAKLNGKYPIDAEEKTDELPSMIVIDVEKRNRLIDDVKTLFNQTNPISRELVSNVNLIKNISKDEKLAFCKNVLRPYLHDTIGLNSVDSSIAVVMTMWRGGFDPDKTAAYLRERGCFDFNELELVRSLGGKVGSCIGNVCRATTRFIQYWSSYQQFSDLMNSTINVRDDFSGTSDKKTLNAENFATTYETRGTFRTITETGSGSNVEIDMYVNNDKERVNAKFYFKNLKLCRIATEINNEHCKISRIIFEKINEDTADNSALPATNRGS